MTTSSNIWNDCPVCKKSLTYYGSGEQTGWKYLKCLERHYNVVGYNISSNNITAIRILHDVVYNGKHYIWRYVGYSVIIFPEFRGKDIKINHIFSIEDCLNVDKIDTYVLFS